MVFLPPSQRAHSVKHYRSTTGGLEFWSPRYLKDLVTEKIQMIDYQRALEIFQPILFLCLFRAVSIARAEYLMNSRVREVLRPAQTQWLKTILASLGLALVLFSASLPKPVLLFLS